jgi:hypothetical protein
VANSVLKKKGKQYMHWTVYGRLQCGNKIVLDMAYI